MGVQIISYKNAYEDFKDNIKLAMCSHVNTMVSTCIYVYGMLPVFVCTVYNSNYMYEYVLLIISSTGAIYNFPPMHVVEFVLAVIRKQ